MKIKLSTLFTLVAILFFMASINYWRLVATRIDGAEGFPFLLLKTSSLLVFVFCFIFVIKNIQEYPFKGVHLVCFLWYVFMPVVVFFNRGQFSDYFFTLLWPLLFQTSYLLIIYNVNYIHVLRRLFIVIFIVGFFLFLMGTRMAEGEQTNTIFFSLLTLPWLLCIKRNFVRMSLFIILSLAVLFSMKRSSIIIMMLCWGIYGMLKVSDGRKKMLPLVSVIFLVIIGTFAFDTVDKILGGEITERLNKEESDEGRGRLAIYAVTVDMQLNSPKISWLLGHGHYGVYRDSPLEISAHNDFLEVLYDYGIAIFVLYLCLCVYVIKRASYLYKRKSFYLFPYLTSISIFFVMSMVSHLILYTSYFNFLVLFWGSIEGLIMVERREQTRLIKKNSYKNEDTVCDKRISF